MIHVSTLNWAGGSVEQPARRQFGQFVHWQEKSGSKMAIIWYETGELGVTMHRISFNTLSLDYDQKNSLAWRFLFWENYNDQD